MLVDKTPALIAKATDGFATTSRTYRVDSPAFVFDVLCNKMYNNPLSTMVQEYLANARDAHREAKCTQVPVRVTLPNLMDQHLVIRDFGPGLTEERIDDVFVSLGASTKSSNNEMTGGFGLGAKIGWAYGDSFTVVSVVDGTKTTYLAYRGTDGVGRMDTLSSENTDEANGVAIKIFIKSDDIRELEGIIEKVTYFWDVPPVCNTTTFRSYGKSVDTMLLYIATPFTSHGNILAVVDGIPYHVNKSLIPRTNNLNLPGSSCSLFLFFDVGEIDVAINREGLDYNTKTIDNITHSIQSIADMSSDKAREIQFMPKFADQLQALRECYTTIGAPAYITAIVQPYVVLKGSYYTSNGMLHLLRSAGQTVATYAVEKTDKVKNDIQIRHNTSASTLHSLAHATGIGNTPAFPDRVTNGVIITPEPSARRENPEYVALIGDEDFTTAYRDKCRTIVKGERTWNSVCVLVTQNKSMYDFLVYECGYASLNHVEDTVPQKIVRNTVSRACGFVETDVKNIFSRSQTVHIDEFMKMPNVMWCAFKECEEARSLINTSSHAIPTYGEMRCFYLTAPQIQYMKEHNSPIEHFTVVRTKLLKVAARDSYVFIEDALSKVADIDSAVAVLRKSSVYYRHPVMEALLKNVRKFDVGHPVHTMFISRALETVFNTTAVCSRLDKVQSCTRMLRRKRHSRMHQYYTRKLSEVKVNAVVAMEEFNTCFPMLSLIDRSRSINTEALKHIIDYLLLYSK